MSHEAVGDMVVGRVSVALSMYEMVPRSNYIRRQQVRLLQHECVTYIDAAGQALGRKCKLKIEVVHAFGKPPFSAEYNLVLEQRNEAISKVAARLLSPCGSSGGAVVFVSVSWRVRVLEDLGITV